MSQNTVLDTSSPFRSRYLLKEQIWQGPHSIVYRATHIPLDREVAIKFLTAEALSETSFARFQKEAQAIARLQHPNILQVYDFDRADDGRYFMATEYFPNGDLQHQLDRLEARGQRFTIPQAVFIAKAVAIALRHAHNHGIIHRDIKPSNIFVSGPTRVVVGDFGLAKLRAGHPEVSTPGVLIGTPAYMSPEQADGGTVDERTDIYAAGVVLFYLLAGKRPFAGSTVADVIAQHLYAPIPDIIGIRPDVPVVLKEILERALAKTADDRYPSADAMLRDLEALDAQYQTVEETLQLDSSGNIILDSHTPSQSKTPTRPVIIIKTPSTQSWEIQLGWDIPYLKYGLIVGALSLLIGLGVFWALRRDDSSKSTADAPIVSPASEDEMLILISPMYDATTGVDISQRVMDWLTSGDIQSLLGDRLRVEVVDKHKPIESEAAAQAIGEQTKAKIVIWGRMDAGGWHITVNAPQHPPHTLQTLQLNALYGADFEANLNQQVPVLIDLYTRVLLMSELAREGALLEVFYLTFTMQGVDENILPLADRPLDKNIVNTIIQLIKFQTLEADDSVSRAIEIANEDITLYYLRWVANVVANQNDLVQRDIDRLKGLLPDSDFDTGLQFVTYYMTGQGDAMIRQVDDLEYGPTTGFTTAFSMTQQVLIGEGEFAQVDANLMAYSEWAAAHGVSDIELVFLDTTTYLDFVQGDTESLTALLPDLRDFRTNRFYLAANTFLRRMQPTTFPAVSFSFGAFGETMVGQTGQARLTLAFGLGMHPDYFLLNWQQAQLEAEAGNYQQAYDLYDTAINRAPVPFPVALYDQAVLVAEHAVELESPRPVCELLRQATKTAQTDPAFYAVLLGRIGQLQTEQGCGS